MVQPRSACQRKDRMVFAVKEAMIEKDYRSVDGLYTAPPTPPVVNRVI